MYETNAWIALYKNPSFSPGLFAIPAVIEYLALCVCMYVYMYVCMYMFVNVCVYIVYVCVYGLFYFFILFFLFFVVVVVVVWFGLV